jgi:peroxiredoxin
MLNRLFSHLLLLAMVMGAGRAQADEVTGNKINDFQLRDYRGKEHSLADHPEAKAIVVAFLGCDCPLAKLYGPRLQEMANEYGGRGVVVIGINANQQDNMTELGAYARIHGITFPLLKDAGNAVADQFGAERTPEVFLLDAERNVRYRGRIDDQYLVGVQRKEPSERNLAVAIEEVLAGKEVSNPRTKAPGCIIGRVSKVAPQGEITYTKDVARILQNRCVECHRPGEIGPFPLTSYDEVVGWGEMMLEVINEQRMPPWSANPDYGHFRNDARMSDEEKDVLSKWVANGSPLGDPKDMPEPVRYTDGWQIGTPDRVIYMSDKPFQVPAEGVVEYQHIEVDPGFTEDMWVAAAEARPGNRAVVHHIIVFVRAPGAVGLPFMGEVIGGYAPGMPPVGGYEGMAAFIPKGSKLVFQMHYTPNGSSQEDLSYIGFRFAKASDVKKRVKAGMAANFNVDIPPNEANYKLTSRYKFRTDSDLVTLMPHMHLRGKSFRYELVFPDGRREILLDVPRYDFNWQLRYELEKPLRIPKGSEIQCTAYFDNSAENLANPDPSIRVRWGDQTWEEMMIGWFTMTIPKDSGSGKDS